MGKSLVPLVLVAALIGGCSTSQDAANALAANWAGRNTDQFFTRYGAPQQRLALNNGNALYTWAAQHVGVHIPAVADTSGTVVGNSFNATTNVYGGGEMSIDCTLQITADPTGRILQISIMRDTVGMWGLSRCSELFR